MSIIQYITPFTPYPYVGEGGACDLCGSERYELICEHDRRFKKLQTVACLQCGVMRTNPMPTAAEVNAYYASLYRLDYGLTSSKPSRRHLNRSHRQAKRRMRLLAPTLVPGARVLDFGCGAGVFLSHAKSAGCDVLGLEPGEAFARYARERFGVAVVNSVWEDADVQQSFDVITAVEVIEHLRRPVAAMRWLAEHLSADGVIYITVPNMEPQPKETFRLFHFAHLYHFTPETLVWAGAAAGLEPDPRFAADGTRIVFRKAEGGPRVPTFDRDHGAGLSAHYPKASIAGHLVRGRWMQSMRRRITKTVRDTMR